MTKRSVTVEKTGKPDIRVLSEDAFDMFIQALLSDILKAALSFSVGA